MLFEAVVWKRVLQREIGPVNSLSLVGWIGLVQVISTPLSVGMALLGHLVTFNPSYSLTDYDPLFWPFRIYLNPFGALLGFLVLPILVEIILWQESARMVRFSPHRFVVDYTRVITPKMIVKNTCLANAVSFSIGALCNLFMEYLPTLSYGLIYLTMFLFGPLFIILLVFLAQSRKGEEERRDRLGQGSSDARTGSTGSFNANPAHKRNLQVLGIVAFVVVLLLVTPMVEFLRNTPTTGPTHPEATLDSKGRIHVVWEEVYQPPYLSFSYHSPRTLSTIKHSILDGIQWSNPSIVTPTRDYAMCTPLTFVSGRNGELALGWIDKEHPEAGSWRCGPAYYQLFNGSSWCQPQPVSNSNRVEDLQLSYDLNGDLYASWVEQENYNEFWIMYWLVGSSEPHRVAVYQNTTYNWDEEIQDHKLFPKDQDQFSVLWGSPRTLNYSIFINGSWSEKEIVGEQPYSYGGWDAVMDSNGTIHIFWIDYIISTKFIFHRMLQNGTLSEITVVDEVSFHYWERNHFEAGIDPADNVFVTWRDTYYNCYISRRWVNSEWVFRSRWYELPSERVDTVFLMLTPGQYVAIQQQWVGTSNQLIHYTIEGRVIRPLFTISTSVHIFWMQIQLFLLWRSILIIIGVAVFLPVTIRLTRGTFTRIFL